MEAKKQERLEEDDSSDSESDDEDSDDEISVNVRQVDVDPAQSAGRVSMLPEEERSTHFLAIKIRVPEIAEKVQELQAHVVDQEPVRLLGCDS